HVGALRGAQHDAAPHAAVGPLGPEAPLGLTVHGVRQALAQARESVGRHAFGGFAPCLGGLSRLLGLCALRLGAFGRLRPVVLGLGPRLRLAILARLGLAHMLLGLFAHLARSLGGFARLTGLAGLAFGLGAQRGLAPRLGLGDFSIQPFDQVA